MGGPDRRKTVSVMQWDTVGLSFVQIVESSFYDKESKGLLQFELEKR